MPVGFGYNKGIKTMGSLLPVMAHLKKVIVQDKSENNCLAHALIIDIAKLTDEPNYEAYRRGGKYTPKAIRYLRRQVSAMLMVGESPNSKVFRRTIDNIKSSCILC